MSVSRRQFVGGIAAALGYLNVGPEGDLFAQTRSGQAAARMGRPAMDDWDSYAHLSSNENCWGPPEPVMKAMNSAWKYANRYGYPDANIVQEIAKLHGVKADHVLLTSGSSEALDAIGTAFLQGGKKVLGVEPTYTSVYQHATTIKSSAIKLPLDKNYRQNIPALVKAANDRASEIGLVYIVNPNNPTGIVVSKDEIKELVDGVPKGMPVLIDEAYHHFVDDPAYATSDSYVREGRPVIVTRTFSKIAALAGMRLGYAIAPPELTQKMRPYGASNTINALVKWGGAAALRDLAGQAHVKKMTIDLREKTRADLEAHGYDVIPSQTNFFMVHLGRDVQPVIQEFRDRKVLVGRPFPPMTQHLRVSVGTADEMARFMTAFKEIFPAKTKTTAAA